MTNTETSAIAMIDPVGDGRSEHSWLSPHPEAVGIKIDHDEEEGPAPIAPAPAAAALPPPDGPPPGTPPASPQGMITTGVDATVPQLWLEKEEMLERQILLSMTSTTRYQGPGYDRDKALSPSISSHHHCHCFLSNINSHHFLSMMIFDEYRRTD